MFTRQKIISSRRRVFGGVTAVGIGFVVAVTASGAANAAEPELADIGVTERVVDVGVDRIPNTGIDFEPPGRPVTPIEPLIAVRPFVPPVVTSVLRGPGVVEEGDRNGDGKPDWWGFDMDGDGDIDIMAFDDDYDGWIDRHEPVGRLG